MNYKHTNFVIWSVLPQRAFHLPRWRASNLNVATTRKSTDGRMLMKDSSNTRVKSKAYRQGFTRGSKARKHCPKMQGMKGGSVAMAVDWSKFREIWESKTGSTRRRQRHGDRGEEERTVDILKRMAPLGRLRVYCWGCWGGGGDEHRLLAACWRPKLPSHLERDLSVKMQSRER